MRHAPQPEGIASPVGRHRMADAIEPTPPIEPLLKLNDWPHVLNCSRRLVERLRSAGKLPPPDLKVGRARWRMRPT